MSDNTNVIPFRRAEKPAEVPKAEASDFGERLQRIRASLEKINKLMAELKQISKKEANQCDNN